MLPGHGSGQAIAIRVTSSERSLGAVACLVHSPKARQRRSVNGSIDCHLVKRSFQSNAPTLKETAVSTAVRNRTSAWVLYLGTRPGKVPCKGAGSQAGNSAQRPAVRHKSQHFAAFQISTHCLVHPLLPSGKFIALPARCGTPLGGMILRVLRAWDKFFPDDDHGL